MKKILLIIILGFGSITLPLNNSYADQCFLMGPNGCVLTEAQAQASNNGGAGQCNSSNPCHTYAVLDNTNKVENVIVCQTSVCGSETFANKPVVLQVLADPETGKNQNAFIGTTENPITYDSQTRLFNQGSESFPAPAVTRQEVVDSTTLTVTINSQVVTFGPDNYENGVMTFNPKIDANTSATVSATEVTSNSTKTESTILQERKTALEVSSILEQRNLSLLQSKINRLLILLGSWLL
jgi:hypothetical protein